MHNHHWISREEFRDWAVKQKGDFDLEDQRCCPMANFGRDVLGMTHPYAGMASVWDQTEEGQCDPIYFGFDVFGLLAGCATVDGFRGEWATVKEVLK